MFIMTQENEIINPDHCQRIRISGTCENYVLRADLSTNPTTVTIIAKYNKEMDADYALCSLFKAMEERKSTWDPSQCEITIRFVV